MEEKQEQKVYNVDIADLVALTARLPDGKQQTLAYKIVQDITLDVRNNPNMTPERVAEHVSALEKLDAARPSIEALRAALTTPTALLRICTAFNRLWGDGDPSKPQVSIQSRPGAQVKRSEQEDEAWKTIISS